METQQHVFQLPDSEPIVLTQNSAGQPGLEFTFVDPTFKDDKEEFEGSRLQQCFEPQHVSQADIEWLDQLCKQHLPNADAEWWGRRQSEGFTSVRQFGGDGKIADRVVPTYWVVGEYHLAAVTSKYLADYRELLTAKALDQVQDLYIKRLENTFCMAYPGCFILIAFVVAVMATWLVRHTTLSDGSVAWISIAFFLLTFSVCVMLMQKSNKRTIADAERRKDQETRDVQCKHDEHIANPLAWLKAHHNNNSSRLGLAAAFKLQQARGFQCFHFDPKNKLGLHVAGTHPGCHCSLPVGVSRDMIETTAA